MPSSPRRPTPLKLRPDAFEQLQNGVHPGGVGASNSCMVVLCICADCCALTAILLIMADKMSFHEFARWASRDGGILEALRHGQDKGHVNDDTVLYHRLAFVS